MLNDRETLPGRPPTEAHRAVPWASWSDHGCREGGREPARSARHAPPAGRHHRRAGLPGRGPGRGAADLGAVARRQEPGRGHGGVDDRPRPPRGQGLGHPDLRDERQARADHRDPGRPGAAVDVARPAGPAPARGRAGRRRAHRARRRAGLARPRQRQRGQCAPVPDRRRRGGPARWPGSAAGGPAGPAARQGRQERRGGPRGRRSARIGAASSLAATAIGAGAVIAGGVGQALRRRFAVSGARSQLVLPPATDTQVMPSGTDLGIPGATPFVTPNSDFYRIDTALLVPQVSPDHWRLKVHGMVDRELELTFADLLARPMVERDVTLSCVSNEVGGSLVGNAVWRGRGWPTCSTRPACSRARRSSSAPRPTAGRADRRCRRSWTGGTRCSPSP